MDFDAAFHAHKEAVAAAKAAAEAAAAKHKRGAPGSVAPAIRKQNLKRANIQAKEGLRQSLGGLR